MFADTRMTFGEHIEDLRNHLLRAIKGFLLAMVASFLFAAPILRFMTAPIDRELANYHRRTQARRTAELVKLFEHQPELVPRLRVPVVLFPRKLSDDGPNAKAVLPSLIPALIDLFEDLGLE
ncbi:MAG: twin-arginine translocase subunit TatC, partial [Gemmataceae bacterium]|nr:twin-arginine translocase subunit TatC [Gemmataceae bacterium]